MQKYTLFIGIDISKDWIDVCLTLNGQKKEMLHFKVDNNKKGFKELIRSIRNHFSIHPKEWFFTFEHTGVYSLLLCRFLEQQSLTYSMLSPLHLKYSLGLRRGKSDPADAADIARYSFVNRAELKPTSLPSDKLLMLKSLLGLRTRLIKSTHGISVAAKELSGFEKSLISSDVSNYSKKATTNLRKLKQNVEKRMLEIIRSDEELNRLYELVTSVKGAGFVTANALLVYTLGFTAFDSSRQFAVYSGLVPFGKRSGTSLNIPASVSHLANKRLKGWISNGAMIAQIHDKELAAYYLRRIKEGKNKFVVQNAVRNKFLHRIFAVVKRGTPYVELNRHIH